MAPTYNLSLVSLGSWQKAVTISKPTWLHSEFEINMGYIVSLRPAWAIKYHHSQKRKVLEGLSCSQDSKKDWKTKPRKEFRNSEGYKSGNTPHSDQNVHSEQMNIISSSYEV